MARELSSNDQEFEAKYRVGDLDKLIAALAQRRVVLSEPSCELLMRRRGASVATLEAFGGVVALNQFATSLEDLIRALPEGPIEHVRCVAAAGLRWRINVLQGGGVQPAGTR